MESHELAQELKAVIVPLLEREGLEMIEIKYNQTRGASVLTLLVDRHEGGITLGECMHVNRTITAALDSSGIIKEPYALEVSSPGLDRPLINKADFLRCRNRAVRFFLNTAVNGKIEWEGTVTNADDESVAIDASGTAVSIPLMSINKAKQIIQ
jgi:ribosome maturation factor RimP